MLTTYRDTDQIDALATEARTGLVRREDGVSTGADVFISL